MDGPYQRESRKSVYLTLFFLSLLLIGVILAACVGKYPITPWEIFRILTGLRKNSVEMAVNVVMGLRVPRILASVLVGAALSVSGAAYQGVFRNPLVSPDYLGVSGGACVGAAIGILLSLHAPYITLLAFIGGILAMLAAMSLPVLLRSNANIMLVLSGVIVGAAMSSALGFLKYMADPESQLASIIYWTMGSFSYVTMGELLIVTPIIILPMIALFGVSWWIDILSVGESDARSLGANVGLVRGIALGSATLLTAASVSIAGTIGWVGLLIPHICRLLVGPQNGRVFPLAAVAGGLFLLAVDTVTRTVGASEMPVGILTGALGIPFFCWLLYRQRKALL